MDNEELKKKIIDVLKRAIESGIRYYYHNTYMEVVVDYEALADALVAAGIGDVKSLVDGNCVLCVKDKGCMRLYPEGDIKELEHRAEVAERQAVLLSKWLAEKTRKDYPWQAWLDAAQKQAEKELAEEKKDE